MDVKERIQNYLDDKGIKTTTFEKEVGMSNGYWRKTKSISANVLTDILKKYTDLSIDYILGKSEEMFCGCTSPEDPSLYHPSSSASVDGVSTDSQRTQNGGTTEAERIKELEAMLAERDRVIAEQAVKLSRYENKQ